NSRHADLSGAIPEDHEGRPLHIRQQVAASVRTVPEGALEFIAMEILRNDTAGRSEDLERYCRTAALTTADGRRAEDLFNDLVEQLRLDLAGLIARIDLVPSPAEMIRRRIEQAG